jgi:predicted nicotinamide N-methyase
MHVSLSFESWTDGERQVKTLVDGLDRWEVHCASRLTVTFSDDIESTCLDDAIRLQVVQAPRALANEKMGVGACLWDGSIILGTYLACQPRHSFIGCGVVELGAGVGLLSTLLCKLGARKVYATDLAKVLPLLQENADVNGCAREVMEVMALEWGVDTDHLVRADNLNESFGASAAGTRDAYPDLVIASDVTYHDNEASMQPDTVEFVKLCRRLCGPRTEVLIGLERRSGSVRDAFIAEIRKRFDVVSMVDLRKVRGFPKDLVVDHIDVWRLRLHSTCAKEKEKKKEKNQKKEKKKSAENITRDRSAAPL